MDLELQRPIRAPWWQIALVGRNPKRTVLRILILVGLCFLAFQYAISPIRVQGISMLPTYKENAINCINRLAYRVHEPQRGDVVAISLMAGKHVLFLKRIVGLPGETIGFSKGHVVVNGQIQEEPYLRRRSDWESAPITLDSDEYFVVGDNRSMPQRDHEFGAVKKQYILGKVML